MTSIKFYGTRGSAPMSGENYIEFGEATTCILFRFDNTVIMLDSGSGALNAIRELEDEDELHLLISHTHHDHIQGIMHVVQAFSKKKLHIYGKSRGGVSLKSQLERVMSEPLWPVAISNFPGIIFHEIEGDFEINDVKIEIMESNHPGGCLLFKLSNTEESVVTAFDFCHLGGFDEKLIEFAKNADTLIYDGNMDEEEFSIRSHWGHSTPEAGAEIAISAGIKKLYITHHGAKTDDELARWEDELRKTYPLIQFARCGMKKNKFAKLLDVGIALTAEKDKDRLLEIIIRDAMDITGADGGTLYMLDGDKLNFRIMITRSKGFFKGGKGEPIDLPPVKLSINNVCAASIIQEKTINIPDVYNSDEYDFSGTRQYDKLNDYGTMSVLVVPMRNDYGEFIGVLQLINATEPTGTVVPFDKTDEKIVESIASQAAISLTNMEYSTQIGELLYGFVRVMSTGIDAITPYNANHTRNMVKYGDRFFDYQARVGGKYRVSDEERREILMAIWLHDIGKLITPLDVMNKSTRLGEALSTVEDRFGRIELLNCLSRAKNDISESEYLEVDSEIKTALDFIREVNHAGFLPDDKFEKIKELKSKTYIEKDGTETFWLTEDEFEKLSIRKGTLTDSEREIMQGHVSMTQKMLSELDFPRGYRRVAFLAGAHHELINGKGYPDGIGGDALPWQARFITILDIFDALTSRDRPYKPALPIEKAFAILDDMAKSGDIDSDILESFKVSKVWD